MREKKTKVLIGSLLALVMFASSLALLMYSKQNELSKYVDAQVEVVIASRSLDKGVIISAADIQTSRLPKSYINFTPLTKAEIIGRYTKVKILASEPLRPEKLSLLKPENEKGFVIQTVEVPQDKSVEVKSDTITIPLNVFKNVDNTLKKGDYIDIVSVYPKKEKKKQDYNFNTKYIALHVPIHSFIRGSVAVNSLTHVSYDEKTKQNSTSVADSVVLVITPSNIKNLLPMYYRTQELNSQRVYGSKDNRGHLWMVKALEDVDQKLEKEKSKMMINRSVYKAPTRKVRRVKDSQKVNISYED